MNIVLYTNDMEPITVIEVPDWGVKMLQEGQHFRVTAPPSVPTAFSELSQIDIAPFKVATIWAERIVRNGRVHWLFFTNDDVEALLLESRQLPGQRKDYQAEYQRGYFRGFGEAFLRIIGP